MPSAAGIWKWSRRGRRVLGVWTGMAFCAVGAISVGMALGPAALAPLAMAGGQSMLAAIAVFGAGTAALFGTSHLAVKLAGPKSLVRMARMEMGGECDVIWRAPRGRFWGAVQEEFMQLSPNDRAQDFLLSAHLLGEPSAERIAGETGLQWAMELAEARGPEAQAHVLSRGYDADWCGEYLKDAVEAGDPQAMARVGAWHQDGGLDREGPELWLRDPAEAVRLLAPAAEAGDPEALRRMGDARELGEGVPLDLAEAERLWTAAASRGDVEARRRLGELSLRGCEEVPLRDPALRRACEAEARIDGAGLNASPRLRDDRPSPRGRPARGPAEVRVLEGGSAKAARGAVLDVWSGAEPASGGSLRPSAPARPALARDEGLGA